MKLKPIVVDAIEVLMAPLVVPPLLLLYFANGQARLGSEGSGKKLPMRIGLRTLGVPERPHFREKVKMGFLLFGILRTKRPNRANSYTLVRNNCTVKVMLECD